MIAFSSYKGKIKSRKHVLTTVISPWECESNLSFTENIFVKLSVIKSVSKDYHSRAKIRTSSSLGNINLLYGYWVVLLLFVISTIFLVPVSLMLTID